MKAKWVQPETPGVLTLELSSREAVLLKELFGGLSGAAMADLINADSAAKATPIECARICEAVYEEL